LALNKEEGGADMERIASGWFRILVVGMLAIACSSCDPSTSTPVLSDTGAITGLTLSSGSPPTGIAGIDVHLSGVQSLTATSDEAGRYTFSNLSPGAYSIQASGSGLGSNEYDLTVQSNVTVTQDLMLFIFHIGPPTPTAGTD
jgi:hypothetical protein